MSFVSEWSVLPIPVVSSVYSARSPHWQSCQDLYACIQCHPVWKDQADNHLWKTPALRLSTPALTALPLEDLRTLAIRQAKLRARWERSDGNVGFVRGGLVAGADILREFSSSQWILPGGDHLLVHTKGNLALHGIQWPDGVPSLSPQPVTACELKPGVGTSGREIFLFTTSPHPTFACVGDSADG